MNRNQGAPLLVGLAVLVVSLPVVHNESVHYDDELYLSAAQASRGLSPEGIQFAFTTVDTLYWESSDGEIWPQLGKAVTERYGPN